MGDLMHLVLVKSKEGVVVEDIIRAMEKLATEIDTVKSFQWGQDAGTEAALRQGFSHVFLLTFKNAEDFAAFSSHPSHLEFAAVFAQSLENILVFDFPPVQAKLPPPPPPPAT